MQKIKQINELHLEPYGWQQLAFFIDFDGTLVEIADRPDEVKLREDVFQALQTLRCKLEGALAIISGRSIEDIESYVGPDFNCIAGVHGIERRNAEGKRLDIEVDRNLIARIETKAQFLTKNHPELLIEKKPASIALHYRQRPDLEKSCKDFADEIAAEIRELDVIQGKMVVEIKLHGTHKGDAVEAYMQEEPFLGRLPIYSGDDVTDEYAFKAVEKLKGISIMVGPGDTAARFRVPDTKAFQAWLINQSKH